MMCGAVMRQSVHQEGGLGGIGLGDGLGVPDVVAQGSAQRPSEVERRDTTRDDPHDAPGPGLGQPQSDTSQGPEDQRKDQGQQEH